MFRVCRVFSCVIPGSSGAEKWTSVSPWPKALLRAKLVQPLLRVLCPLCGEPKEEALAGEDDVDAAEEEEMQVQTVAAQLVDLLALKAGRCRSNR